ncbi:MAG: gliding motility-associated C-terminal domain-containing protein [Chitinophagaceae bacterium]|nr:gliding motility-associated C-terminal domain-containing protein [Chitinophagaceae bacterium]
MFNILPVFSQQLIFGPDTVCINNEVQFTTNVNGASSYYWGFCSAYLNNIPQGSSIAAGTGLNQPSATTMVKDSTGNYFVFVVNEIPPFNITRYAFGNSLSNVPVASNLGNFGGMISSTSKGFQIVGEGGNYYGFLTSGNGFANSRLIRINFGNSLANNSPVATANNLGNFGGLLINPQDLYVFKEGTDWHALILLATSSTLVRLDIGSNIANNTPPPPISLLNPGGFLGFPTGLWPVFSNGNWHLFVSNAITESITRIDFGGTLLNAAPVALNLGNFGILNGKGPRDISIIKDCGNYYAYITTETSSEITMLDFQGNIMNILPVATNLGNFAGFNNPRYLTNFVRSRDNVYAFTANNSDNSLSRIEFNSCTGSIPFSSDLQFPPLVTYPNPGLYNIYFVSDEGLPTMQVDCKLINVINRPAVQLHNDTTICLGDSIYMTANGPGLYSILWTPPYNIFPSSGDTETVHFYPREDVTYNIHMEFSSKGGCAFDTTATIKVSQVVADAGEDRFVADGAVALLGGPNTSRGPEYSYSWTPTIYLDKSNIHDPSASPQDVIYYYFTVTNDSSGCTAMDTVKLDYDCTDVNLPNAFNPISSIPENRKFRILNHQFFQLEYFSVFDRWGNLVFESKDEKIGWDGTYNNIQLPPDNYVWIVDGYCKNGKRVRKTGTVLLVR